MIAKVFAEGAFPKLKDGLGASTRGVLELIPPNDCVGFIAAMLLAPNAKEGLSDFSEATMVELGILPNI